jgi:vitamin B12 transporter
MIFLVLQRFFCYNAASGASNPAPVNTTTSGERMNNRAAVIGIILLATGLASSAFAETLDERTFLRMYFTDEELTVESATRSPKPVSQTAENITVVTAAEIERMSAHTVADVLNTVTGIYIQFDVAEPGQSAFASIQGSENRQVTVMIDGIRLNPIGQGFADIGFFPVQNIEKIEIIKGPASSTWGSALGGVINIVTKSGGAEPFRGMASQSYGTAYTNDFRVEAAGTQKALGYYLAAGRLESNGLKPLDSVLNDNVYAKFTYAVTPETKLQMSLGYYKAGQQTNLDGYDDLEQVGQSRGFGTLIINSQLSPDVTLVASVKGTTYRANTSSFTLSTNDNYSNTYTEETGFGTDAMLTWKRGNQTIVLGAEYNDNTETLSYAPNVKPTLSRQAAFANDTITFGGLAITPGIRYEKTSKNGDLASPSLGIAYALMNETVFRASAARGFNTPPIDWTYSGATDFILNPNLKMETVESYQAGIESAALKYAWLKLSVFQHNVHDAITHVDGMFQYENTDKLRRDGFDIEAKTMPIRNVSLSAGWSHVDEKNLTTGQSVIQGIPNNVYDAGIHFNDKETLNAELLGRCVRGVADPYYAPNYSSWIIDLHVTKQLVKNPGETIEVFADGHNILNGDQYWFDGYKNPKAWSEAGFRVKF